MVFMLLLNFVASYENSNEGSAKDIVKGVEGCGPEASGAGCRLFF
jgi:hypothetical protein